VTLLHAKVFILRNSFSRRLHEKNHERGIEWNCTWLLQVSRVRCAPWQVHCM